MTAREGMAERWPATVRLNLGQLNAVLAAAEAGSGRRYSPDLRAAMRKLAAAAERRRKAVERAGGSR